MKYKYTAFLLATFVAATLLTVAAHLVIDDKNKDAVEIPTPVEESTTIEESTVYIDIDNTYIEVEGNGVDTRDFSTNISGTDQTPAETVEAATEVYSENPFAMYAYKTTYENPIASGALYHALESEVYAPKYDVAEYAGWAMSLLFERIETGRGSTVKRWAYLGGSADGSDFLMELENGECWFCLEECGEAYANMFKGTLTFEELYEANTGVPYAP